MMSGREENQEELELVAQFKATGEGRYFATLFDRYQKRIYFIAYAIFKSPSLAEDLTQETFVRAFEQIESFDEQDSGSSFYAWLCRICRNACFDEARKAQVRAQYQKESQVAAGSVRTALADEISAPAERGGYQAQERAVIFRQLDEELRKIAAERRICWLLFYLDGYSYKGIAEKTGLSFEGVKTHIQAVNRHLKRLFR